MQCACAVLYCHLRPAPLYHIFPHYLINGTNLGKKLLNIKCVFWFCVQLCVKQTQLCVKHTQLCVKHTQLCVKHTQLILSRIQRDVLTNAHVSVVMYITTRYYCQSLMTLEFPPTDGHTTTPTVTLHNFSNAPKNDKTPKPNNLTF